MYVEKAVSVYCRARLFVKNFNGHVLFMEDNENVVQGCTKEFCLFHQKCKKGSRIFKKV